jgi:hypothetical protein
MKTAPEPVETYGPFLPPGAQMVNGRLVPIPPVPRTAAEWAELPDPNARPVDLSLLAPEGWMHKGGGCGFTWNGFSVVRRRG